MLWRVFIAARRLSLVVESGGYSSLWCMGSHCSGFSCYRAQALGAQASLAVAHRHSWLCGMWDLPRPGIELVCPALHGRFVTTGPAGKPLSILFLKQAVLLKASDSFILTGELAYK